MEVAVVHLHRVLGTRIEVAAGLAMFVALALLAGQLV